MGVQTLSQTRLPAESLIKLHKELARRNCAFFASENLRGPAEAPYNGKFLIAHHHEHWAKLINEHRKFCVLSARSHGKSHFFSLAYPLWKAGLLPDRSGCIFSGSQDQAQRILGFIKHEVETNHKFEHLLPRKINKSWSAKEITLANGHTIYARGYGTKARGAHPDWIICDDILNDEDAYSERIRKKNIEYFYSAILPMLEPGGQLIVVGTPYSGLDLYAHIEADPTFHYAKYPAIIDQGTSQERALWPERFSLAALAQLRDSQGPARFSRELMCQPVTDVSSLFPSYLFEGSPTEQAMVKLSSPYEYWQTLNLVGIFMGVDFALSSSVGSDYTCIWTMGVDCYGNRWIIDIFRDKGLPFTTQKSKIIDIARRYQPTIIHVESNQAQRIFGDELIRETDLPIRHFQTTGEAKHSLEKGIPALKILFENRKVRIPRGDKHSVDMTNTWIDEMISFSIDAGRVMSVGKHDDTVMAFWLAERAACAGSFGFSFESQPGDEEAWREMNDYEDSFDEPFDLLTGSGYLRENPKEMSRELKPYKEVAPSGGLRAIDILGIGRW